MASIRMVASATMQHRFLCGSIGRRGLKKTMAALLLVMSGRPVD